MLIYEGIYMLEAHNTLFVPQTTRTRNVAVGNQKVAKPNMYFTNRHCTNHNIETCKSKKKKEPTITTTKATIQIGKPPSPLNGPCHICGIMGHKLTNYPIW